MSRRRPPIVARALLRFILPADLHEAFAGDLEERFQRVADSNEMAARRGCWKDVLSPTVLRFGATLFVRSLQSAADADLGFSTREPPS